MANETDTKTTQPTDTTDTGPTTSSQDEGKNGEVPVVPG
jgi:hypothetical protein